MRLLLLAFVLSFSLHAQHTDGSGRKQGYWKKTDEKTGKLIYEGAFKDDKPVGRFKYYYPNDSVRAILDFKGDGTTAYARLFHMNGKRMAEGRYAGKEIKDSVWTYYDEAGVLLSRETWSAGKKHGPSFVYLPDGLLSESRNFVNGVQHGAFKEYFDGKAIRAQGKYVNGELDGRVSYHYPNGIEAAAGLYKNGSKNGPWIYKDKSGKITEKELYKNGIKASDKETEAYFINSRQENKSRQPAAKPSTPAKKK